MISKAGKISYFACTKVHVETVYNYTFLFISYHLIHLLLSLLSIWYMRQQWNKTFKEHRLWITFRELWIYFINRSLCCLNRPFSARFSCIVLTHALHCRSATAHALQFPLSFGLNKSGFSVAKWDWVKKKGKCGGVKVSSRERHVSSISCKHGKVQVHRAKYVANALFSLIRSKFYLFISMREKGKMHLES